MKNLLKAGAVGVAVLVLGTGTTYAATGGTFVLGRGNTASTPTALTNSGSGPVLSLSTKTGQPPLAVSAQAGKATNLNADKLDGLDSSLLQRRVVGSCQEGDAIRAIAPNGSVTCDVLDNGFVYVTAESESGIVHATCPVDFVAVGGGALTDVDAPTFLAASASLFDDETGRDGWLAATKSTAGAIGGWVGAEVYCWTGPIATSSGAALRRGAPARAGDSTARAYLDHARGR